MPSIRQIEKKWIKNFQKSPLVQKQSGIYIHDIAYQLFYGRQNENYPSKYPDNFVSLYSSYIELTQDDAVDQLLDYFHFIGITIRGEAILKHLSTFPNDFDKLFKKAYYLLRTLANYDESLNTENPYYDNNGDLYFLLRIESEESITGGQLSLFEDLDPPDVYKRITSLPDDYENDPIVNELFNSIETTNHSYFITGKAGTGKSTFIHYLAQKTKKKILLCAFTGIAAINIGGQTLHSIFRFPLKPLLPNDHEIPIFKEYFQKRKILEQIDSIVIDEVSMLRSDLLEGLDFSLRNNGGNPDLLFGGKQLIFVGDVFQLPPVTDSIDETEIFLFNHIYGSEYFFDSPSFKKLNPHFFEFKKAFRQKDDFAFINLLDDVRTCNTKAETIIELNKRYFPDYIPNNDEYVITLTTNNSLANSYNSSRLEALNYTKFLFSAEITGEFSRNRYPTNKVLELKRNAQIIFIKNDSASIESPRRWVNGTIAKIDFINKDSIDIKLSDGSIHKIERVTWENRRYKYDREKKKIVSEVIGTFTQYPIKLAWAITIHKSQGLTFDKVIVDIGGGAFVNGQLYTALSRCRSFEGLYLKRKINDTDIIADNRIMEFYKNNFAEN